MLERLAAIYDPPRFQSSHRNGAWFEGWYFKLMDAKCLHPIALIPGVSHDDGRQSSHSFVQVIRPGHPVSYHRYDISEFAGRTDRFEISVGPNRFSASGLDIDLPASGDVPAMRGTVSFGPLSRWPVSVATPGIMGWYRYVPRMECYHAVVSMDHSISGRLDFAGTRSDSPTLDFTGGRGYAEKDWGTSFPSSWVWMQANRFSDDEGRPAPGVSVMCSVARIPWLGSSFTGHIAGLLLESGELLRFATYTGAKLTVLETSSSRAQVQLLDRRYRLTLVAESTESGALKAPRNGAMIARANEALDATVHVELQTRSGQTLFSGHSPCAGVEIMNDLKELSAG